jgi:hypothetical protein
LVAKDFRRAARVVWYLVTETYTDHWKVRPFKTSVGLGIPVFGDEAKAQAFIEANWESLGPGREPVGLDQNQLADFLEKQANETGIEWVVLDPPPIPATLLARTQTVDVASIRAFVIALRRP